MHVVANNLVSVSAFMDDIKFYFFVALLTKVSRDASRASRGRSSTEGSVPRRH